MYDPSVSTWVRYFRVSPSPHKYYLRTNDSKVSEFAVMEAAKLTVNQIHLKQAWDTAQINARQDWVDWIYRLGVELIRQSPSHALRACITLVETQSPLAKELFNGAFLSCWNELYEQYQVRPLPLPTSASNLCTRTTSCIHLRLPSSSQRRLPRSAVACWTSASLWSVKQSRSQSTTTHSVNAQ